VALNTRLPLCTCSAHVLTAHAHICVLLLPILILQAPDVPAGLRNLGNTCYVNAAMQFLHSLPAFRSALYKLEPELAGQQIVKQMR
jgi:ubiquitin C-terminal hydrolase